MRIKCWIDVNKVGSKIAKIMTTYGKNSSLFIWCKHVIDGDVVALKNEAGDTVAEYSYDA